MRHRVVILGNSLARFVVPERSSRDDGTFGEWVERLLRDRGIDVRVENCSRWYELIGTGNERWRRELRQLTPEVVVAVYGSAECQTNVLPTWLSRHFMTWDQGLGGVRRWYRQAVMPKLWPAARAWQRRGAMLDDMRTWRLPPKRFRGELLEMIGMMQHEKILLVLVDIPPFGDRIEHHMPGVRARRLVFQKLIETVVAESSPLVRIARVSEVVEELGAERALPDGLHLSPAGHRRFADVLLADVEPFLREREAQIPA